MCTRFVMLVTFMKENPMGLWCQLEEQSRCRDPSAMNSKILCWIVRWPGY